MNINLPSLFGNITSPPTVKWVMKVSVNLIKKVSVNLFIIYNLIIIFTGWTN